MFSRTAIRDEFSTLPISPQKRWALRNKRDGKCMVCGGGPLTTKLHCAKHAARLAAQAKTRRRSDPGMKARLIVFDALGKGTIKRGHCHCGAPGEAHHEDYSKPLEITWLCPKHHKQKHGRRHLADLVAEATDRAEYEKQYHAWLNDPKRKDIRDYNREWRRRRKARIT